MYEAYEHLRKEIDKGIIDKKEKCIICGDAEIIITFKVRIALLYDSIHESECQEEYHEVVKVKNGILYPETNATHGKGWLPKRSSMSYPICRTCARNMRKIFPKEEDRKWKIFRYVDVLNNSFDLKHDLEMLGDDEIQRQRRECKKKLKLRKAELKSFRERIIA